MKLEQLRLLAINQSMFPPTSLAAAFNQLGFVQADPIRSPARAEELILRHRVQGYVVGDLNAQSNQLGIEEDYLYAHGFMTREVWQLLHPRQTKALEGLHLDIYQYVKKLGIINADQLAQKFGRTKVTNWWGGSSQATRLALDELHYWGFLRIVGRQNGLRQYQYLEPQPNNVSTQDKITEIILRVVTILGPVQLTTLNQALYRTRKIYGSTSPIVNQLLKQGKLQRLRVDSQEYIDLPNREVSDEQPSQVKFLAPFDPLVWDRKRFEHLWGWPYRFEAYIPAAKRIRGYYAMPLLWRDDIIGWVNVRAKPELTIEQGYCTKTPASKQYKAQFEAEVERLRNFLKLA